MQRPVLTSLVVLALLSSCASGPATTDVAATAPRLETAAPAPNPAPAEEAARTVSAPAPVASAPATLDPVRVRAPRAPVSTPVPVAERDAHAAARQQDVTADPTQAGPIDADAEGTHASTPAEAAARAALTPVLDRVPGADWDLDASDLSAYDPTQPTSWVVLAGGDPAAPVRQLVLFHHGIPVQAAFAQPFSGAVKFRREGQDAVAVTYYYEEEGVARPEWGTLARLTYTWDAPTAHFLVSGTIDGDPATGVLGAHALDPRAPQPLPVAGAAPGAGGVIPAGAREAVADVSGNGAVVVAPDLGVTCVVDPVGAACGVDAGVGTPSGVRLDDARTHAGAGPSDAIVTAPEGSPVTVLGAGDVVYFGPYVVAREGDTVTAWNSLTGNGEVLTASSVRPLR